MLKPPNMVPPKIKPEYPPPRIPTTKPIKPPMNRGRLFFLRYYSTLIKQKGKRLLEEGKSAKKDDKKRK